MPTQDDHKRLYDTNYVLKGMRYEDAVSLLSIVRAHHKTEGTSTSGEHYRVACAIERMIKHLGEGASPKGLTFSG